MRAPADRQASSTARFSTPVTPEGTHTTTRGCAQRFWWTFWMKCRSICSVTSKSAITPSLSGRIAWIVPGRAPEHALGLDADRVHFAGARVDRHDARLRQHDAAPAHVDERVGRAQVDRHVAAAEACQIAEDAHVEERVALTRRRRSAPRARPAGHFGGQSAHRGVRRAQSSERPSRARQASCERHLQEPLGLSAPSSSRVEVEQRSPAAGRRRSRIRPRSPCTSAAPAPWIA